MSAPGPDQIGRYRIEATLGRGAMGVIYRAHDPVIDRKVAIKLVRADLLESEDRAEYVGRFQQEAQAAGRCAHPNIVSVYDFALHDGNPYIAMEFIDGITLNHLGRDGRVLTIPEITTLAAQVLDGLEAAHALGVIHRDIKPANIMLTRRLQVKVADFGISRLDSSAITSAGSVIGTPSYMSPEQCRGDKVDARSDVFSTGVVLYELVTGRKPFAGTSAHEIWHNLLNTAPPDPATLRPDAPPALHAAILRSLAKAPADRFASAAAMAQALRDPMPGAADPDHTVLAPRAAAPGPEPAFTLDGTAMMTVERELAHYVGPIAALLLKSAIRKAGSFDGLREALAASIEDADKRARFNQDLQAKLDPAVTRPGMRPAATLSDEDLNRAQQALTRHLGPVARVLVKRAAPACSSVPALWEALAKHIDTPADRTAFLRHQP